MVAATAATAATPLAVHTMAAAVVQAVTQATAAQALLAAALATAAQAQAVAAAVVARFILEKQAAAAWAYWAKERMALRVQAAMSRPTAAAAALVELMAVTVVGFMAAAAVAAAATETQALAQSASSGPVQLGSFRLRTRGIYKCLTSLESGQPRNNSKRAVRTFGLCRPVRQQSVRPQLAPTIARLSRSLHQLARGNIRQAFRLMS